MSVFSGTKSKALFILLLSEISKIYSVSSALEEGTGQKGQKCQEINVFEFVLSDWVSVIGFVAIYTGDEFSRFEQSSFILIIQLSFERF